MNIITKEDFSKGKILGAVFESSNIKDDMKLLERCFKKIELDFDFRYDLIKENDKYINILSKLKLVQPILQDTFERYIDNDKDVTYHMLDLKQMAKFLGVKE